MDDAHKRQVIREVRYSAEHMGVLKEQDATSWLGEHMSDSHAKELEGPWSFSYIKGDRVLACVGVNQFWADRGEAWAVFEMGLERDFLPLFLKIKRQLSRVSLRRIEARVDRNYVQAHRLVEALGFDLESPVLPFYFPDGRHGTGYVRVN